MNVKEAIRRSPVGPLALFLHRHLKLTPQARADAYKNDRYDAETVAVMEAVLKPDSVCVDVGAHAGAILAHMVRLAPRGKHVAFEPIPNLAAALRSDYPGVKVVEAACSNARGSASFNVATIPGRSGLHKLAAGNSITVDTVVIDDHVDRADLIKLDIEGAEYCALQGARSLLDRCHPVLIFESAKTTATADFGVSGEMLWSFLDGFGYCLTTMQRWLTLQRAFTKSDFLDNWDAGGDFYFMAHQLTSKMRSST